MNSPLRADRGDAAIADVENEPSFNVGTRSHRVDRIAHCCTGKDRIEAASVMPDLPTAYRPVHHAITGAPASDWAGANNPAELIVIEFNYQIIKPGRNRVGRDCELGF